MYGLLNVYFVVRSFQDRLYFVVWKISSAMAPTQETKLTRVVYCLCVANVISLLHPVNVDPTSSKFLTVNTF